jgi:hypothetical protein
VDYSIVFSVVFSFVGGALAVKLWSEWTGFKDSVNSFIGVASQGFQKASEVDEKVEKLTIVAEKMAQDQSEFMNLVGARVLELKNEVFELKNQIFVPSASDSEPISDVNALETSYESTYMDLIAQGLDPEMAKYKAAEYELSKLADMGGIQSLGFGE